MGRSTTLAAGAGVGSEAGGALGAARLAWMACGGKLAEVCRTPDVARVAEPDAALAAELLEALLDL